MCEGSWGLGGGGGGWLVSSRRRWPPEVMLCSQSTDGEHRRAPDLTSGELLCGGGQDGWVSGEPRGHSHPAPYLQAPVCRCENGCCRVTSGGGLHSQREKEIIPCFASAKPILNCCSCASSAPTCASYPPPPHLSYPSVECPHHSLRAYLTSRVEDESAEHSSAVRLPCLMAGS